MPHLDSRKSAPDALPSELMRRAATLGYSWLSLRDQLGGDFSLARAERFIRRQEQRRARNELAARQERMRLARELLAVARHKSWPQRLVRRALRLDAPPRMLIEQIRSGFTPEQALRLIVQEEVKRGIETDSSQDFGEAPNSVSDLRWMTVPTEWGIRVKPGAKGLTLRSINVAGYGDIPDVWPFHSPLPRGAFPLPIVPSDRYPINNKVQVWAENAVDLYEEAIQRKWRPSTEIPWSAIEPLPVELERSMSQLSTFFCERAFLSCETVGKWLSKMSYGYHEVKLYLATVEFDCARHFEVFRKRAFCNGGGMGRQTPGNFNRAVVDGPSWTVTSCLLDLLSGSFLLGLSQLGGYIASNEGDFKIFQLVSQDIARRVSYGIEHLQYALIHDLEARAAVERALTRGEEALCQDEDTDQAFRGALIILLGGGLTPKQLYKGLRELQYFKWRWVRDYVRRLAAAGIQRKDSLSPPLKKYAGLRL